ncbi:MAG: glycosyltransferase family 2 protein [Plesiomonas shigelloides]
MSKVIISIITVTFNNMAGLKKTIDSVQSQTFSRYEHVIIDGDSTDGTADYLFQLKQLANMKYISEPDTGIYNAMNKGVTLSKGDWLIFLNAGDVFCSRDTLEQLFKTNFFQDETLGLIYGDKMDCQNRIIKAQQQMDCLFYGEIPACHQSMFFRNDIRYNESYKIFGDIDLLSKLYVQGIKHKYIELPVSIYEGGGISSKISWLKRKEKFRSLFYNFGVMAVIKNYFLNPVFYQKIFKAISLKLSKCIHRCN